MVWRPLFFLCFFPAKAGKFLPLRIDMLYVLINNYRFASIAQLQHLRPGAEKKKCSQKFPKRLRIELFESTGCK